MQDDTLYNMTDNTEYQANLFAADLLIDDEEIKDIVQNEDLDYFGLCSSLNATPELMSFKLYSLTKRGQAYHTGQQIPRVLQLHLHILFPEMYRSAPCVPG